MPEKSPLQIERAQVSPFPILIAVVVILLILAIVFPEVLANV